MLAWRTDLLAAAALVAAGCADEDLRAPEMLSDVDSQGPHDLQTDGTDLYWGAWGPVFRVPTAGGETLRLTHGGASCDWVAVDADRVFCAGLFPDETGHGLGVVASFPKTGGDATRLYVDLREDDTRIQPGAIALDEEYVYWADHEFLAKTPYELGHISRVAKNGGPVERLADGLIDEIDLAVDEGHVYWTDRVAGSVSRVAKEGGEVELLAAGLAGPKSVALDDEYAYVAVVGTYENQHGDGTILRVDKETGTVEVLAENEAFPWEIAADADGVAWLAGGLDPGPRAGGSIRVLPRGGSPYIAAEDIDLGWSLTMDRAYVYWAILDGYVFRAVR